MIFGIYRIREYESYCGFGESIQDVLNMLRDQCIEAVMVEDIEWFYGEPRYLKPVQYELTDKQ